MLSLYISLIIPRVLHCGKDSNNHNETLSSLRTLSILLLPSHFNPSTAYGSISSWTIMISSARTQTRWPSEISIFASFIKHGDRLRFSPQLLLSGWRQLEEIIAITSRHLYSLHLCLRPQEEVQTKYGAGAGAGPGRGERKSTHWQQIFQLF